MNLRSLSLLSLLAAAALGALTGCASTGGDPAGGRPESAAGAGGGNAFNLGIYRGREDGAAGLSRTPSRHYGRLVPSQTAEFNRGYEIGYNQGIKPGGGAGFSQPLTAVNGPGAVTIKEGNRVLAVAQTASPFVEETRFIQEQERLVVKSRGGHGPATVQLFDSKTGAELGRVMAYQIQGNQPPWAAGMGE